MAASIFSPAPKPTKNSQVKKQEIIVVLGGPGSGKGTQCSIMQRAKGYCHISAGDIVRKLLNEHAESNAESKEMKVSDTNGEIEKIRNTVKQGALLDDKTITKLIKLEMAKYPDALGFLIDGYPRTLSQVAVFEKEIKLSDKALYFDAPLKILEDRILERANVEKRTDDNKVAIAKRMNIYSEQTLPVVAYFKQALGGDFHQIDASQSIDGVAKSVRHAIADDSIVKVNFLTFLQHYFSSKNYYAAVDVLEKQHNAVNFEVSLSFVTMFYIIQNKHYVSKVLSANTTLGYHYNNFNVAHHHPLNIVALQAFANKKGVEKNPLWKDIHTCLAHSVGDRDLINHLIKKHINKFLAKPNLELDVAFEHFLLNFWCDYMFGSKVNPDDYRKTRAKLLEAAHYAYYDSRLKAVPYLGNVACRFYGYLQGDKFKQVDHELQRYIEASESGLMRRFRGNLQASATFPQKKIDQAVLDNCFDYVLVFDFIHNAMYETLVSIVKNSLDTTDERRSSYASGVRQAFLFAYRSRIPQQSIQLGATTLAKGVPIYINLLEAAFLHSHGPRSCVGIGVSNWIQEAIWEQLKDMHFRVTKVTYPEERAKLARSLDVPISPERYTVKWTYPRDYLQRILPSYKFKGVEDFYDVLKTYENPALMNYIVAAFVEKIADLNLDKAMLCIAAPEVRGIPIAAIVASVLDIPLILLRKPHKIPGRILSQAYSTAYSSDTVEISQESKVTKHVILIDDGISSGGTTLACCNLLKQLGGNVEAILVMINHTLTPKPPALLDYNIHALFDFKNKALTLADSSDKTLTLESKESVATKRLG